MSKFIPEFLVGFSPARVFQVLRNIVKLVLVTLILYRRGFKEFEKKKESDLGGNPSPDDPPHVVPIS